jgi:hypothetical protein
VVEQLWSRVAPTQVNIAQISRRATDGGCVGAKRALALGLLELLDYIFPAPHGQDVRTISGQCQQEIWYGQRDSNPQGFRLLVPKTSVYANATLPAHLVGRERFELSLPLGQSVLQTDAANRIRPSTRTLAEGGGIEPLSIRRTPRFSRAVGDHSPAPSVAEAPRFELG